MKEFWTKCTEDCKGPEKAGYYNVAGEQVEEVGMARWMPKKGVWKFPSAQMAFNVTHFRELPKHPALTTFEVGTRVRLVEHSEDSHYALSIGDEGVVVSIMDDAAPLEPEIGVRWDKWADVFHDCDGACEMHHGWYVGKEHLEVVQ